MTPERWQQIEKLCYEALELDSERREVFLNHICASDEELGHEVKSMLAAHDRAGNFLQLNAMELEAEALALEKTLALPMQEFGHYQIVSRIGAGGMGEVWLARDTKLDRKVALKFLPAPFTSDKDRLQRFTREAKAASALNHPNIITIHEIGEAETAEGKIHFIATEFIEGQTLRQFLTHEELTLKKALDIATQAAAALDAAHGAGIVHRDVKPENIMVRPDGLVKVLDFGLAKLDTRRSLPEDSVDTSAKTQPEMVKTQPGMILGTLRYMSPEQARGREVDARTDIFSLGVVLYELIAKQPLFAGETSADVIAAIINKEPESLADFAPDTPDELERIVQKALAKDARDRYQTARDLQIDLQNLKQESEINARLNRSGERNKSSASGRLVLQTTSQLAAPRFSLRQLMLTLPVVVLLLGMLWWGIFRRTGQMNTRPELLKSVEVVTWQSKPSESYSAGAFSPDGKWVAFTSTQSGSKNIWIKQAASGEAQPSTKDNFDNESPIWSPNGEEIAFVSFRNDLPGIWRKPPFGSALTLIKSLPSSEGNVRLLRWSPTGETIYYESGKNLFALDVNSGATRSLTKLDPAKTGAYSLSISPDEKTVAYVNNDADESQHGVWIAPLSAGSAKRITNIVGARNTAWHPDGKQILYSSRTDGIYQIFVTDLESHQPMQLTLGDKDCLVWDVSLDRAKVLYGSSKEESDIWGVNVAEAEEFLVASDTSSEIWPDVSSDSQTITYQAVMNLSQGNKIMHSSILTARIGAEAEPFEEIADAALPKWSPDGIRLAVIRVFNNVRDLWVVSAGSRTPKQLTTSGIDSVNYSILPYQRWHASNFAWSVDGNQIIYSSLRSGISNLWLVSAEGSKEAQVTDNNDPNILLYCPLWSSDGKRLAYSSRTDKAIAESAMTYSQWVRDSESGSSKLIFQSNTFQRLIGWSAADEELILATLKTKVGSSQPADIGLVGVSVKTGMQRPIALLPSTYLYNIHLSADKRTIAFTSNRDGRDNIWIIPVRGGQAKKLTANNDPRLYFSSLAWAPNGRTIYYGKQTRKSLLSMITNFQ